MSEGKGLGRNRASMDKHLAAHLVPTGIRHWQLWNPLWGLRPDRNRWDPSDKVEFAQVESCDGLIRAQEQSREDEERDYCLCEGAFWMYGALLWKRWACFLPPLWGGQHNHPLYPKLSLFSFLGESWIDWRFSFKIWILLRILQFDIQESHSPCWAQYRGWWGWSISSTVGPHHTFVSQSLLPGMACALYTWVWQRFMDCLWPTVLTLSLTCLPPLALYQPQVFLGNILDILPSCCKIHYLQRAKKGHVSLHPSLAWQKPSWCWYWFSFCTYRELYHFCLLVHFSHLICGTLIFPLVDEAMWY